MNIFDQKKSFVLKKFMTHFWTFLTKNHPSSFHAPAQPREGFICVYFFPIA